MHFPFLIVTCITQCRTGLLVQLLCNGSQPCTYRGIALGVLRLLSAQQSLWWLVGPDGLPWVSVAILRTRLDIHPSIHSSTHSRIY